MVAGGRDTAYDTTTMSTSGRRRPERPFEARPPDLCPTVENCRAMTRRAVAALLALLTITAGCSALTGGATTFTAGEVSVSESAQSDTGYSLEGERTLTITRTFAGQNVTVNNKLDEYARSSDLPVFGDTKVARFTVFATPAVEVAGQGPFNPIKSLSNRELALRLQKQYGTIQNVQPEGNRTVTMLGEETTVGKFRAEAETSGGQTTEVFLHITKVKHEGDFVVAVAVYPTQVDGEQERVDTLINGVQHESGESSAE
jgi:hypothetical protein